MKHCDDCGTILEKSGICNNCDEAAFIMIYQGDFLPEPLSNKFLDEASAGIERAKRRRQSEGGGE